MVVVNGCCFLIFINNNIHDDVVNGCCFLIFFSEFFMNVDEDDEKSGRKKMKKAKNK